MSGKDSINLNSAVSSIILQVTLYIQNYACRLRTFYSNYKQPYHE